MPEPTLEQRAARAREIAAIWDRRQLLGPGLERLEQLEAAMLHYAHTYGLFDDLPPFLGFYSRGTGDGMILSLPMSDAPSSDPGAAIEAHRDHLLKLMDRPPDGVLRRSGYTAETAPRIDLAMLAVEGNAARFPPEDQMTGREKRMRQQLIDGVRRVQTLAPQYKADYLALYGQDRTSHDERYQIWDIVPGDDFPRKFVPSEWLARADAIETRFAPMWPGLPTKHGLRKITEKMRQRAYSGQYPPPPKGG